jgi:hypothetical protein
LGRLDWVRAFSFLGFLSLDPCVLDGIDRLLGNDPQRLFPVISVGRKLCVSINVAC